MARSLTARAAACQRHRWAIIAPCPTASFARAGASRWTALPRSWVRYRSLPSRIVATADLRPASVALLDAEGMPSSEGEISLALAPRPAGLMMGYQDDAQMND